LLILVRSLTFSCSSLHCLYILYFTSVRRKLEYVSVVWNSITFTNANKFVRIQQKFSALCFNRFFPHVHYSYAYTSEYLRLRLTYGDASPLCSLPYSDLLAYKFCISLSETVGVRVSARYIRGFFTLTVCSVRKNCPARCAQLLMLFVGTLIHLKPKLFLLIMLHDVTFLIIKLLIVFRVNLCTSFSSRNDKRDSNFGVIIIIIIMERG
jgi:hypothetical protein